jgi:DnaJ-domain-containing protein 1
MTDYFALFAKPRQPWLDPAALKEKYHALARQAQPNPNVNEAYRVLVDPKLRLQHLLTLEGNPPAAGAQIPSELIDLFMQLAPVLQSKDPSDPGSLKQLSARVAELFAAAEADLRVADASQTTRLKELYARFSYLTKWRDLLDEKHFELAT